MTKIEWTDYTWNPVWGCKSNCDYCYARNIANRFAKPMSEKNMEYGTEMEALQIEEDLKKFIPTWLPNNFRKQLPKKPSKIFVGSMSDIAYWEKYWIYKVAKKMIYYKQHTFQLLTKSPKIYRLLENIMPNNVWFGITVTKVSDLEKIIIPHEPNRTYFISFEPLLEDLSGKLQSSDLHLFDWVIIGTMSGRNRISAKNEWIESIIEVANAIYDIPIFVKQIELNGIVEKDVSKFPEILQFRQFPKNTKLKHG